MLKKYFDVKDDVDINDLTMISPHLLIVFSFLLAYADRYSLPVKVSSIIRDENDGISASSTHQTGRALDVSIAHFPEWTQLHIRRVVKKMNAKYRTWGTCKKGGTPKVIVYHKVEGGNYHLHLQVRRGLQLMEHEL